jgi:uncharacterized protein DUF1592/uncharacterized protein DUF1588/uncharacterized protein DUF1595/uncharacterized protein DUF1587
MPMIRTTLGAMALCALHVGCVGRIGGSGDDESTAAPPGGAALGAENELRRLSARQYQNVVVDVFDGLVAPSPAYPKGSDTSVTGYSTEAAAHYLSAQSVEKVMLAAEDVAEGVAAVLDELLPCSTGPADQACAEEMIDRYARRAYRHTPTADERQALVDAFVDATAGGASFDEAVAMMVAEMLQMPQFLYVIEDAAPGGRQLGGIETASRLSFLFWDSIPDDELLDLAEQGALDDPAAVQAQARRMLESPKADAVLARFFREWTGTEELSSGDKVAVFPFFDTEHAASMNESFDRFVVGSVRDGGDLRALLRSPEVQVDAVMADFFGVAPPASGWSKVSLDAGRYSGLLTQPAFLATMATTTTPRYVLRGKFVVKRLLCVPFGDPPANAMSEFGEIELPTDPTAKDISDSVRARGVCGSCHAIIDPPGLALEQFDALGRFRSEYESGKSIDPSGTLALDEPVTFADPVDMLEQIADLEAVKQCFARQLFRFSMSREEVDDDDTLADLEQRMQSGALTEAFLAITATDAFRYRRDP